MRQEKIILVPPNRKIHIKEECVISQRRVFNLKKIWKLDTINL